MKSTTVLILLSILLAPPSAAQADLRLIPQPREMRVEGSVSLPNGITVTRPANVEDRFAALDLTNALKERGIHPANGETGPGPRVVLLRADALTAQSVLRRHSLTLDPARYYFRTVPRFETSAEAYAFLNRIVTIGVGETRPDGAVHRIDEIL